jgi:glucose-6-phosphate isomerase
MWDWVGGRYSLWSTIGLPIALAIGSENFQRMLAGACEMDEHFQTAPIEVNMPIIMALLGIWNINFWGSTSHCIIPYCHYLRGLPAHIQQLDMESNGKSISVDGKPLDYLTGPAIWGSEGVNSQHAFFQQIHQSNSLYPVDFIVPLRVERSYSRHHDMLVANCFAQSQAMMRGKSEKEAYIELSEAGYDPAQCEKLAPHKAMSGNKPNNVLMLSELSPKNVGALIALYEHKVVAQGMLWNINSFDQWGVELGKQLSKPVSLCIGSGEIDSRLDCSTAALIKQYLDRKKTNE